MAGLRQGESEIRQPPLLTQNGTVGSKLRYSYRGGIATARDAANTVGELRGERSHSGTCLIASRVRLAMNHGMTIPQAAEAPALEAGLAAVLGCEPPL